MRYLMTFIFYILTTNGFSQVWVDSDAKWTFDYFNVGENGTWRWEYTHDTIIQGHQSQVISQTKYRYWDPGGTAVINYENTFTYTSNDSVFYFKDDRFFLLYDFGAQIGDTWVIAIDTNFSSCQDTAFVQVVDTGSIIINGQEYRTITLETISESIYALNGLCVEKFGIIPTNYEHSNFGFKPGYQYCGPIIEYDLLTFRCFEDSNFPIFNPTNKGCDTLTSTNELKIINFNIYPNPTTGQINIDLGELKEVSLRVYSLDGQIIYEKKNINEAVHIINISKATEGVYVLEVKIAGRKQYFKLIKQ